MYYGAASDQSGRPLTVLEYLLDRCSGGISVILRLIWRDVTDPLSRKGIKDVHVRPSKTTSTEEVQEFYKKRLASRFQKCFNEVSDELGGIILNLDTCAKQLNLGIETWVTYRV